MRQLTELNKTYKFQLVSRSPRRRKILQELGLKFSVKDNPGRPPEKVRDFFYQQDIVRETYQKMQGLTPRRGEVLIACDTIVVYNFRVFGKPKNRAQAISFLQKLSGKKHYVLSCVALLSNSDQGLHRRHLIEKTAVYFRKLTSTEILDYVATGEPLDKAGAYGIQGKAKIFVKKICGCYDNVVGLPVYKFLKLLARI